MTVKAWHETRENSPVDYFATRLVREVPLPVPCKKSTGKPVDSLVNSE